MGYLAIGIIGFIGGFWGGALYTANHFRRMNRDEKEYARRARKAIA